MLNFLWYLNETSESLEDTMTDCDGHRHQYIVPAGRVRSEVWEKVLQRGRQNLNSNHLEVLESIEAPFIQSITDFVSYKAAFEKGRVLMVGDALSLFRPHTASSTNQAAFDCLCMERLLNSELNIEQWEKEVLQFARLHWLRSIWYGENYQRPITTSIFYGLQYWNAVLADLCRTVWYWQPSKLRW